MTVATNLSRVQYNGNSVTTAFAFSNRVTDASQLAATRTIIATGVDTPLILNDAGANGFSVSGVPGSSVTVNTIAAPATGTRITIYYNMPLTQTADYVPNDPFPAETHEGALDKLTIIDQQLQDSISRALKFPATASTALTPILPAVPVDGYALVWDGTTGLIKNVPAATAVSGIIQTASGVVVGTDFNQIYDNGGIDQAIVGGGNNTIGSDGDENAILGGRSNLIGGGAGLTRNAIVGGSNNTVGQASNIDSAAVIAGDNNQVEETFAVIIGGSNNAVRAGAESSVVIGGHDNQVSAGEGAVAIGGANNFLNADGQVAIGGDNNFFNAGATNAVALGGSNNTVQATAVSATVRGERANATLRTEGAFSNGYAGGGYLGATDVCVNNKTTTNAVTTLFLDGNTATTYLVIPSDTTWAFEALVCARRSDADNESAAYKISGCIDNNAGTVALVGSVTAVALAEDTVAWDATAVADNTNKSLNFRVTGENSKTIYWNAAVRLSIVKG